MLTDKQLCENSKRQAMVLIPAFTLAIALMFAYLLLAANYRDSWVLFVDRNFGRHTVGFAKAFWPILMIPLFLFPIVLAEIYTRRFSSICPFCAEDITRFTSRVLSTRCCPKCDEQVISGGVTVGRTSYECQQHQRSMLLLVYWLWCWPLLSVISISWHCVDPLAFRRCPQVLFIFSVLGTATSGWSWVRTWDRRYLLPFVCSLLLLIIGVSLFWKQI